MCFTAHEQMGESFPGIQGRCNFKYLMVSWGFCGKPLGFDIHHQNNRGSDPAEESRWSVIKDEYPHCPLLFPKLVSIKA